MIIQFSRLLCVLLIIQNVFSAYTTTVMTRDKDMDMSEIKTTFSSISADGKLEDKNFKIVNAKGEEAIILSKVEDPQERIRAASVFYHLMKAKNYFIDEVNSQYVSNMSQITVRLNITNQFNSIGHFAHDNLSPEHNNALSIPPGEGRARFGVKSWGHEIWFRPAKVVDLPKEGLENNFDEVAGIFTEFRLQSRMANFQRFVSDLFLLSSNELASSGLSLLGSTALIEVSFLTMKKLYGAFQGKKFFLDTSFIPEVVYHEFAHVALSDHLTLSHSSPV